MKNKTIAMFVSVVALYLFSTATGSSQTITTPDNSISYQVNTQRIQCDVAYQAQDGTYEFIPVNIGAPYGKEEYVQEVFTSDILCFIEENRHLTQTIEIKVSEYTIVRIYYKNYILER